MLLKQQFPCIKFLNVSDVEADGEAVDFNLDQPAEAVRINLKQAGETTLTVTYTAPLTDSMMGIYRHIMK